MAEIDLIPVDYRNWLTQQSLLRRYRVALIAVNLLVVGAGFALGHSAAQAREKVAQLKTASAITQQQQAQLEHLKTQESEYERRWSLLRGLRAGAAVDEIFTLIDSSLVAGDLWFLEWTFRRAGVIELPIDEVVGQFDVVDTIGPEQTSARHVGEFPC